MKSGNCKWHLSSISPTIEPNSELLHYDIKETHGNNSRKFFLQFLLNNVVKLNNGMDHSLVAVQLHIFKQCDIHIRILS